MLVCGIVQNGLIFRVYRNMTGMVPHYEQNVKIKSVWSHSIFEMNLTLMCLDRVFRVQDERLLVAHVPSADAERGRDGSGICF